MSLNIATKIITQIEKIDLKDNDAYDEIYHILNYHLDFLSVFGVYMVPHEEVFYVRARIIGKGIKCHNKVSDFSYNRKPELITIGRANKSEQAILYAGRNRITALAEVNIIENKMEEEIVSYSISRWQINDQLRIAAILNPDSIDHLSAWELPDFLNYIKSEINEIRRRKPRLLKLYKYFASKFNERVVKGEEDKYKITSAFTNIIFSKHHDIAGLMYQSVKFPDSYNLAIRKEIVDQNKFIPIYFVKDTYKREKIDEVVEIERQISSGFDPNKDIVEWNSEPEILSP